MCAASSTSARATLSRSRAGRSPFAPTRYCDPSRGRSGCRREGSRVWKRAWSVATRSSACSATASPTRRSAGPCAPWRSSESPASASRGCCTSSRTGSSSFRRRRTTSRHAPSRRGRTSRTACSAISSHRAFSCSTAILRTRSPRSSTKDSRRTSRPPRPTSSVIGWASICHEPRPFAGSTDRLDSRRRAPPTSPGSCGRWRARTSCSS